MNGFFPRLINCDYIYDVFDICYNFRPHLHCTVLLLFSVLKGKGKTRIQSKNMRTLRKRYSINGNLVEQLSRNTFKFVSLGTRLPYNDARLEYIFMHITTQREIIVKMRCNFIWKITALRNWQVLLSSS